MFGTETDGTLSRGQHKCMMRRRGCQRLLSINYPWDPHLPTNALSLSLLHHGRRSSREIPFPLHIHVLPPRHARRLRQTLWQGRRERIIRQDALHQLQGARTGGPHHTTPRAIKLSHGSSFFQGMDLEYKIKDASGKPQVVRVEFDPPLRGYDEVKPRLLGMKADADEALGTVRDRSPRSLSPPPFSPRGPPSPRAPAAAAALPRHSLISGSCHIQVKAPQITHFEVPFQIWITASLLLFLIYSTSVPPHSTSKFWSLARALRHVFPHWVFIAAWAFVGVAHTSEGLYVVTLARKHHMPWPIAVRIVFLFRSVSGPLLVTPEPDILGLADGLGQLWHRFWLPRAYEAAPSYQASADRVYHEGSLIDASSCGKEITDVLCIFEDFELHVFSKPIYVPGRGL